jgi:P4 family phage/plasmid primase-like protien
MANLPTDDRTAAELIHHQIRPDEMAYVPGDKQWFLWDGKHHRPDNSNQVGRVIIGFTHWYEQLLVAVHEHIRAQVMAARPGAGNDVIRRAVAAEIKIRGWEPMVKYGAKIRGAAGLAALRSYMMDVCGVGPDAMADRYPEHLNTDAGIIELLPSNGVSVWPHHPKARMSYLVAASPRPWSQRPDEGCPMYASMLRRSVGGVEDVYWYLVKALGYSLLGSNPLQLVFFLTGPTANGKSALLRVLSTVLGQQLAYQAQPALVSAPGRHGARHPRHEATMRGKRLIVISETAAHLLIDEMQLKRLTGEESLAVELLYDKTMTDTMVSWVIFIANNEMPSLLHLDPALRRRIIVIPMGPTIPEELRDPAMVRRILDQERDGILSLMMWGCAAAMADGGAGLLVKPGLVEAKTAAYAAEQNSAAQWLAEMTVPNGAGPRVSGSECYQSYVDWGRAERDTPLLMRRQFYATLAMVPGVQSVGDENHVWFTGFELKDGIPDRWPGT